VNWMKIVGFGSTAEFDVTGTTQWGLFDQSESRVHMNVTVPPDPRGMNMSELKAYNITAWGLDGSIVGYSANDLDVESS